MPSIAPTVVMVSTQRAWHGGEEQERLLADGLRLRGCRCVVLARRNGEFARRMAAAGHEVETFPGGGRSPAAIWHIRRILRQIRPDVLHLNDSHSIDAGGIASLGLGIPVRVAARRVDFHIRSPRRYRWFCDCLICVSNAVAETCRRGGVPNRLLRVVHDGVDPSRSSSGDRSRGRSALSLSDDQTLLLTVASLTDPKGHCFLLEAMPEIVRRKPSVVLALAGDGELRNSLEQQAVLLKIDSHVRFLGYRDDIYDLIHAADLFVLPSHKEGLCSTLIDVMLAGRPIVATTAGGIPDLLTCRTGFQPVPNSAYSDDANGTGCKPVLQSDPNCRTGFQPVPVAWLVPPRDPQALAGAIVEALNSPEKTTHFQRRAKERAEREFTADRMVDRTLAVFSELLP